MKLVNQLAKLPEMSQAMQQMSMEMTKVFITAYTYVHKKKRKGY